MGKGKGRKIVENKKEVNLNKSMILVYISPPERSTPLTMTVSRERELYLSNSPGGRTIKFIEIIIQFS